MAHMRLTSSIVSPTEQVQCKFLNNFFFFTNVTQAFSILLHCIYCTVKKKKGEP